jgi:hypothetical protein
LIKNRNRKRLVIKLSKHNVVSASSTEKKEKITEARLSN